MLEPTEYEIEPLVIEGRPDTGVAGRYGRAWLGVVLTNTNDGTEYVHLPAAAAHPRCRLMAAGWSQAAARSRRQHNRVLQHALHVEPRLQPLIDQAGPQVHRPSGAAAGIRLPAGATL